MRRAALTPAALVIGCCLCALTGCSKGDAAPPVASVTVTVNKPRVPVGGPVEFTYRFEMLPGASISTDNRVFVQVKDDDGEIVWSDDHEPSVPTSQWKPGQIIEYTRTSFVPARLATGEVAVFVGLYDEERRLPLKGLDPGNEPADRSYQVATLQIAPEAERIFVIYKSGWHKEENPASASDPWKWTQQSAVLAFENPKADVVLLLDYDGRPDVFTDGPQTVTLTLGNEVVHTMSADSEQRRLLRLPLSAAALGTDPIAELRIDVDKTFVPARLPAGGRDDRQLGIRVYHAFVDRR
jgi:hypothetical protein